MNSRFASIFFSRRFYILVFLVAALAFQVVSSAQSTNSAVAGPDLEDILCPQVNMCITDPLTGRCMHTPCLYPIPTPTPGPVCVTEPCQVITLPTPLPAPSPICKQFDYIDMCTADPLNEGRCMQWPQPPCISPNALPVPVTGSAAVTISEFRFRGPGGANDEFVELFNTSSSPITVNVTDGSAGWALVASDGVVRFTVPAGTVIPGYGHYLAVNALGYSLGQYPAGNGTTATGDTTYILDIPDRGGIALFNTANPANFTGNNRLDAAGYSGTPPMYREGAGFPVGAGETLFNIEYSFYRDLSSGLPRDTNDNVADFKGIDTNATNTGAGQHLGAPGPENLSSPLLFTNMVRLDLIDPAVTKDVEPNRARDTTPDPFNNSPLGTMSIRRTIVNTSNQPIKRLRFRIVDITTYPYMSGTSDIRAISSNDTVVTRSDGTSVFINGTTLETPPSQINGGGWNSTLSLDDVTPTTPLYPNQSISLQFLVGIQQSGYFRFFIVVEALP
jgi:hypothetical protein